MSTPPGSSPGGYYAGPPARPPANNSGGVWKALGVGCAAIFVLVLIAGVVVVRSVKDQIAHPSKNSVFGIGITLGKAITDGITIQQAVVRYHQQNGHYPASLMTLVQQGDLDGKVLHDDLDDNPNPGHVSWRYTKPAEGAPGNTPILEQPYHVTVGANSQANKIVLTLNGQSQANPTPNSTPSQP